MLDRLQLVPGDIEFWQATPGELAGRHGDRLVDFLKRVLLHGAPLVAPRDVAWFLASYAREAKHRIEDADLEALSVFRSALEDALDVTFEGRNGDRFFRSTLVQTLFYGVFSAWVLWGRDVRRSLFDWRTAAFHLHVPVIRQLFHIVADPGQLRRLRLDEVLDWTGDALNRVDRQEFFRRFDENLTVPYFYEPFLEAFDPELRKRLGVWYTPPEVVKYMVERVDTVLRTQLDIADGLADRRVRILDPACGTGAFLVGTLERIARTLREKGDDALLGSDLKRAAIERVFGFEILPASFVVAHLQLGLFLRNQGVPISPDGRERVAVYLTNALTAWSEDGDEPPLPLPDLEREREAAEHIKREEEILVIIGNPPYDGYAGMAIGEERDLTRAYRETTRVQAPQGQGLNDLYVRFFRVAERRIVEKTKRGVVCFISNYSWLDGLSHTGMRERLLEVFDRIWIDNLNGDKYRTGKLTPAGLPDPSVFSSEMNREGIQVGTAVALMVRQEEHQPAVALQYRELWGREKRQDLLATAKQEGDSLYRNVEPHLELGLPFVPATASDAYFSWVRLTDLVPVSFPGVKTSRDELLVDTDRERLLDRMRIYFDPTVDHRTMRAISPRAMQETNRFEAEETRECLSVAGFDENQILRYCYRPFDIRWLYWESRTKLLDEKRSEYVRHVILPNIQIVTQQKPRREWSVPQVIDGVGCLDIMDRSASMFPLYLRPDDPDSNIKLLDDSDEDGMLLAPNGLRYNISRVAADYLQGIGTVHDAKELFHHIVAIMHAPAYRQENAAALRQDWPRVPLPGSRTALVSSAALGLKLTAVLNPEREIDGVTAGNVRLELRPIAIVSTVGGRAIRPEAGDLDVTVGWGYSGAGGAVMPGSGRVVERGYTTEEIEVLDAGGAGLGMTLADVVDRFGETTVDVYLNDVVYWRNVPTRVWEYKLGGYQVLKKWLSYREKSVLGRGMSSDEARYFRDVVRRLASILLLEPRLNANYQAVVASMTPDAVA